MNINYDRTAAVSYARKWAYKRNPKYYDFEDIGGDCTNFVSQCLLAGAMPMNYTPTFGWYYVNSNNRSPSWSGVEFLYNFITGDKVKPGPTGYETEAKDAAIADIIQLSFGDNKFSHSLLIVDKSARDFYVATHSFDVFGKRLSEYFFDDVRFIHISGGRR